MKFTEYCTSSGSRLVGRGDTSFPCPMCGNDNIGRSRQCRDQSVLYVCPSCSFTGP